MLALFDHLLLPIFTACGVFIVVISGMDQLSRDNFDKYGDYSNPLATLKARDEKYLRSVKSLPESATLPLNVSVTMSLESITDIQTTYAVIDLYMTEEWNTGEIDPNGDGAVVKLSGPGSDGYAWTTDTYFLLAKSVKYYPESQNFRLDPEGNVHRDRKIRLEAPCTLTVLYFPFDNSQCRILLSSYGFHVKELRLMWSPDAVSFPYQYESLKELGFAMKGVTSFSYLAQYGPLTYDILEAKLNFTRLSSKYLYQVYIPAASLVIMSWVPFWLTEEKCGTPARASIGVMTVLSMLTICSNVKNAGGAVSRNISLLDIFMWVSFGLVVLAMLQFALADFHRTDDRIVFLGVGRRDRDITKRKIDRAARILFPTVYILFNIIYWSYVQYIKSKSAVSTFEN